nr:immunoglobulin heavy chain junction region [Macaca mulatta]MOW99514.1 immunoglobulin heavy chain junction region [Macaca mulatta]MOW99537.1 immunoglobulin heavy chain junction region [Macaca mulatta]MOW99608.1 immunoglobulin heavy chain junction region [Macaca mulatta]MOW99740.1 immunoglobulin heavy chain junction region [Macaca mulatta]
CAAHDYGSNFGPLNSW